MLGHLERLWQDLRHGARVCARSPGLSLIAIVSIAFGTGANVAIFSVADALLLRPLPVERPSDLLTVGSRVLRGTMYRSAASYRDYLDIRDRLQTFDGLLAYTQETVGIGTTPGETARMRFATFVSDNFFQVLGVEPAIGRSFTAGDDQPANPRAVVLISDVFWRSEFQSDPAVVGRTIRIRDRTFTIVGVAPASFTGLHPYIRDSVFLPLSMLPRVADDRRPDVLEARDARGLSLKGRLRPGVTMAEAQAELTIVGRDLERAYPGTNTGQALLAQTELQNRFERRPLDSATIVILTTLSIAVLGVACANVAGLLASRGPVRAREMALRLAIGADRARLVRQLITETLIIAGAGAAGGLVVARVAMVFLRQIQFPSDVIAPPSFELDERTLLFSLAVAFASAFLVGLGPALQTTRVNLATSLKTADRGTSSRRRLTGRSALVATQVALSLVLLTIAVFTIQIFRHELITGPGFRTTQLAKVSLAPSQAGYTTAEATAFFTRVLEDARALPGARSASITSAMPMFSFQFTPVLKEGEVPVKGQPVTPVWVNSIDDRYFETMAIPVLAGRAFSDDDDANAPDVAIVNETLARHYFPGESALGKRLQVLERASALVEIVGIVKTTQLGFPGEAPQDAIYFPYLQQPRDQMVLLAATAAESTTLVEPLRDLVRRADPNVPAYDAQTIETFYAVRVTAIGNVLVELVGGMGLMGMTLTMVGLYGLVSYAVSQRTREIGIRIAIGATYARIVRMVLRQGMLPAWSGLVVGFGLSIVTGRVLIGQIPFSYRVGPETFYVVVPLVIAVTFLAAFLPARRAALIDPTTALRCD